MTEVPTEGPRRAPDPAPDPAPDSAPDPGRVLLIKAKGGLGNRMLSAVCGLVYARLSNRTPVIDWRDGLYAPEGTNAYPLLFRSPDMPDPASVERLGPVTPPIWTGQLDRSASEMVSTHDPDRHTSALVYRRFCVELSRLEHPEPVAVFWSYLPKFGRLRPHLRRDPAFRGRSTEAILRDGLQRWFRPNARVAAETARLLATLPRPVIGVHVRQTDMKIPLAPLKSALRRRLAATPGGAVFLATDNAAVQDAFAAEFPGLHHIDKALPESGAQLHLAGHGFDKQREAENALIDMGVLAGCDALVYASSSTFAHAAVLIGGLGPDRRSDIDRFNLRVLAKRALQSHA